MSKVKVSIVIPVYEDWTSLDRLLDGVRGALEVAGASGRFIIVDDHSSQEAPTELVERLRNEFRGSCVIRLVRNLGHQGAIAVGLTHLAESKIDGVVVVMDADGEDDPRDIPRLLRELFSNREGTVVFASRRSRQKVGMRFRLLYAIYAGVFRLLTGVRMDVGNFSAMDSGALRQVVAHEELWRHYPCTVMDSRIRHSSVPCNRLPRSEGRSKMSVVGLVLHGLESMAVFRKTIAARLLLGCIALAVVPIVVIMTAVGIRVFTDLAIPGWATYTVGLGCVLLVQLLVNAASMVFVAVLPPRRSDGRNSLPQWIEKEIQTQDASE